MKYITIATYWGSRKVRADVSGALAVHRACVSEDYDAPLNPAWQVTHIPTGHSIRGVFLSRLNALDFRDALLAQSSVDWEAMTLDTPSRRTPEWRKLKKTVAAFAIGCGEVDDAFWIAASGE